jgi:hypothetical protein
MKQFEFHLSISEQQYLHYYRGAIRQVLVRSSTGATIQFPASLLTKFVTPTGVHGHFVLTCDDAHKGSEIQRVNG